MANFVFEGDFTPEMLRHILKLANDRVQPPGIVNQPFLNIEEDGNKYMSVSDQNGISITVGRRFINLVSRYFQWLCFHIHEFSGEEFKVAYSIMGPFGHTIDDLADNLRNDFDGPMLCIHEDDIADLFDRITLAHGMAVMAFQYLFFHELGHYYLGHLALKRKRSVNHYESQIMERDADLYASIFMGLGSGSSGRPPFHQFAWQSRAVEERFGPGASGLYLAAYSVSALFQLSGEKKWVIADGGNEMQPPDILRKYLVAGGIASYGEEYRSSSQELLDLASRDARAHIRNFTDDFSGDIYVDEDRILIEEYHEALDGGVEKLREETKALVPWNLPWDEARQ